MSVKGENTDNLLVILFHAVSISTFSIALFSSLPETAGDTAPSPAGVEQILSRYLSYLGRLIIKFSAADAENQKNPLESTKTRINKENQ